MHYALRTVNKVKTVDRRPLTVDYEYMKRTISFYLLCLGGFILSPLSAGNDQQARQIVADFIQSLEQQAIKTDFNLTIDSHEGMPPQTQSGTFFMKGNKFALDMEGISIFFDGKTQWTYSPVNNEVSISEPDASEVHEINPILILREYQNKSGITFTQEERVEEGRTIELTPTVAGSGFNRIIVQLNRKADKPAFIKVESDDGMSIQVSFSNFEKGVNISDDRFVFDKNNYEDVFENDLR